MFSWPKSGLNYLISFIFEISLLVEVYSALFDFKRWPDQNRWSLAPRFFTTSYYGSFVYLFTLIFILNGSLVLVNGHHLAQYRGKLIPSTSPSGAKIKISHSVKMLILGCPKQTIKTNWRILNCLFEIIFRISC